MQVAARGMAALGIRADAILTSPLVRCTQTAAIVAESLGGTPREDRRLRPGATLAGVEEILSERPEDESVMLCAHQPDLSELVGELTGGGLVDFRKGSLAVLDLESARPRGGRLRALYTPAALRMLAGT